MTAAGPHANPGEGATLVTEPRFSRGRASRGKGLRKTTGCLTCRRRHVRCDEAKPVCGGCSRKKVSCIYDCRSKPGPTSPPVSNPTKERASCPNATITDITPDPVVDTSTTATRYRPSTDTTLEPESVEHSETPEIYVTGNSDSFVPGPTTGELDHAETTQHHAWSDEHLQRSLAVLSPEATRQYELMFSANNEGLVSSSQPSSHPSHPSVTGLVADSLSTSNNVVESPTARWLGLLLGDATLENGAFCDLDFETEGLDIFGNSTAQTPRSASRPPSRTGSDVLPLALPRTYNFALQERLPQLGREQLSEKQIWHSSNTIELLPHEYAIFQHFAQHISLWMDFFEPRKPFGTLVPHLAVHNVGLMNAIMALSVRHLSLNPGYTPDSITLDTFDSNAAVRYYYKTLHYSREAMKYDTYKTSLELLAISIIISTYEMLDGSNTDWERHLKGVFWIQRSQVIHGDSGGLRQAVWWAWLCQDVWAAFCEKRKPLTFWRPTRCLDALDPYELGARSVYMFAQVIGFCSNEEINEGKNDLSLRSSKADSLLEMLADWRRHLTVEFEPLPVPSAPTETFPPIWIQPPAFGVAMQLYYCSLMLIFLHQPLSRGFESYFEQRRSLRKCIKTICGIAKTLTDSASSVMSAQCVYIAGLSVDGNQERDIVLKLLDAARRRSGWPVRSLGEDLAEHWSKMDRLER